MTRDMPLQSLSKVYPVDIAEKALLQARQERVDAERVVKADVSQRAAVLCQQMLKAQGEQAETQAVEEVLSAKVEAQAAGLVEFHARLTESAARDAEYAQKREARHELLAEKLRAAQAEERAALGRMQIAQGETKKTAYDIWRKAFHKVRVIDDQIKLAKKWNRSLDTDERDERGQNKNG